MANMIGAGVFTTSGFALGDLGSRSLVLLAWALGGVLAMAGALCYGALGRRLPVNGGEYAFLAATVHPLAGFLAGWISLLGGFTAPIAAAALGLQTYLVGDAELDVAPEWIGSAAIAVAALAHGVRLEEGLRLQNAAVAVKLAVLIAFVGFGGWMLASEGAGVAAGPPPPVDGSPALAFAVTLIWISYAYSGWNAAVYLGGEVRDPQRNLPRALVAGTAVVTAIYLCVNAVFVYAAPVAALAGRADVGAVAAEALGGPALRRVLSWVIALALFTSVSSMVLAGPRVVLRMAQDGLLPRRLASSDPVPRRAVLLQAALAIAVVWVSELAQLLSTIGFLLGLSAAATVLALLRLRAREGAALQIPGHPWVPIAFVAATVTIAAAMAVREPLPALVGVSIVASGLPVYGWMRWRQRSDATPGNDSRREGAPS